MNTITDLQLRAPEVIDKVIAAQSKLQESIRSIEEEGLIVHYDPFDIKVLSNVFIPLNESKALTDNFLIQPGDEVLDVCTGSGVVALIAALKGAAKVVALDVNSQAVACAKDNAARLGYEEKVDIRQSNVFEALLTGEQFDVITANPPFLDLVAPDVIAKAFWDEGLHVQQAFFEGLSTFLKPNGKAYFCQTNIGPLEKIEQMANESGFTLQLLAESPLFDEIPESKFLAIEILQK